MKEKEKEAKEENEKRIRRQKKRKLIYDMYKIRFNNNLFYWFDMDGSQLHNQGVNDGFVCRIQMFGDVNWNIT